MGSENLPNVAGPPKQPPRTRAPGRRRIPRDPFGRGFNPQYSKIPRVDEASNTSECGPLYILYNKLLFFHQKIVLDQQNRKMLFFKNIKQNPAGILFCKNVTQILAEILFCKNVTHIFA